MSRLRQNWTIQRHPGLPVGVSPEEEAERLRKRAATEALAKENADRAHTQRMQQESAALDILMQDAAARAKERQMQLGAGLDEQSARAGYGRDLGLMGARAGIESQQMTQDQKNRLAAMGRGAELDQARDAQRHGFDVELQGRDQGFTREMNQTEHGQQLERDEILNQNKLRELATAHGFDLDTMMLGQQFDSHESALERQHRAQQNVAELQAAMERLTRGHELGQDTARMKHGFDMERDESRFGYDQEIQQQGHENSLRHLDRQGQVWSQKDILQDQLGRGRDEHRDQLSRATMQFGNQQQYDYNSLGAAQTQLSQNLAEMNHAEVSKDDRPFVDRWRAKVMGLRNDDSIANNPAVYRNELQKANAEFERRVRPMLGKRTTILDRVGIDYVPLDADGKVLSSLDGASAVMDSQGKVQHINEKALLERLKGGRGGGWGGVFEDAGKYNSAYSAAGTELIKAGVENPSHEQIERQMQTMVQSFQRGPGQATPVGPAGEASRHSERPLEWQRLKQSYDEAVARAEGELEPLKNWNWKDFFIRTTDKADAAASEAQQLGERMNNILRQDKVQKLNQEINGLLERFPNVTDINELPPEVRKQLESLRLEQLRLGG